MKLPRRLGSTQTTTAGVTLDLPRAAKLYLDSARFLNRLFNALQPIDVNFNRSIVSVFDQTPTGAPIAYQFAFGGVGRFREICNTPATSAGLINQLTANHTIVLPFGATLAFLLVAHEIFDQPFDDRSQVHYLYEGPQVLAPRRFLTTSCVYDNRTGQNVGIGQSAWQEICYQIAFAYPYGALNNGAPSLIGATNTCW